MPNHWLHFDVAHLIVLDKETSLSVNSTPFSFSYYTMHLSEAYKILGIDPHIHDESDLEGAARAAYKRLARQHHPDKNLDNPEATEQFQRLSTAWDLIRKSFESGHRLDLNDDNISFDDNDSYEGYMEKYMDMYFHAFFTEMMANSFRRRSSTSSTSSYNSSHFNSEYTPSGFQPYYGAFYNHENRNNDKLKKDTEAERKNEEMRRRQYEQMLREKRKTKKEEKEKAERAEKERISVRKEAQQSLRSKAFERARAGDTKAVCELIYAQGVSTDGPEKPQGSKDTLLHVAIMNNNAELVKALLGQGAAADEVGENGMNALHLACHLGLHEYVRLLLNEDPNLATIPSAVGLKPIWYSAGVLAIRCMWILVEEGEEYIINEEEMKGLLECVRKAAVERNISIIDNNNDKVGNRSWREPRSLFEELQHIITCLAHRKHIDEKIITNLEKMINLSSGTKVKNPNKNPSNAKAMGRMEQHTSNNSTNTEKTNKSRTSNKKRPDLKGKGSKEEKRKQK